MKRMLYRFVVVVAVVCCMAWTWQARTQAVSERFVEDLAAAAPSTRMNAFSKLAVSGAFAPEMKDVLVDLLVRENNLIVSTLRESNGTEGVSIKYGEGYSTYYDRLLKVVNELADKDSPKVLSAWANASYNAESPLFERLATQYGERMLPFLVEQSGSDVEAVRAQATDRLGVILVHCQRLTASDKNEIHDLVVGALADPSDGPRIAAIRVLGKSGSAADIAALSSVAINDPARYPESFRAPGSRYPLRDRAQSAIEQIRSRELSEKEQRKER